MKIFLYDVSFEPLKLINCIALPYMVQYLCHYIHKILLDAALLLTNKLL